MDLSTTTPVEIDTALAEIYQRYYKVEDEIATQNRHIDDLEKGIEQEAEGNAMYTGYLRMYGDKVLAMRDKVRTLQEQRLSIIAETAPYESEYRRRPWSRFFHVTNANGHIHSSMTCSTCFPTTRYAWLTEMSGQSEEDALEALGKAGHVLCSVCFPNAPVELFSKREDPNQCPGSGRYYDSSLPNRTGYYTGNWAECPECHEQVTVTKAFKLRKHKRPA